MKKTGGPAFGVSRRIGEVELREGGITVRDYFAASALKLFDPDGDARYIAARAGAIADAMMKEREEA